MAYPTLTQLPGALETAAMIARGELSPLEAVDSAINRIERMDAHINAVVVCDFDRALDAAKVATSNRPSKQLALFGVPMTIKESFDIEALPTCWGHAAYADNIAKRDSAVVRKLKDAGAIFLGKTNVPPDLADWQSANPVYGRTHNPHDHGRSPGGSSGGSAAAVASGMVPCEFGTDIGGSVRVPAHFCGIWGHKTSWGLISKEGHEHPVMGGRPAHDGVLSIAGPLARNAQDLSALVELTSQIPLRRRVKTLAECRLLVITDHPSCPIDNTVLRPMEDMIAELEKAGARIDRSSDRLPDLARQNSDYVRMLSIAMARGAPGKDGKRASATDWFDLLDLQARNARAWEDLFAVYDFVIAPPAPVLAIQSSKGSVFESDLEINGQARRGVDALAWAGLATFPNLPATVLPIGEHSGLPCGAQIVGPRWSDLDTIGIAEEIGKRLHS